MDEQALVHVGEEVQRQAHRLPLRPDGTSRQSSRTERGIVLRPGHPEGVAVPVPQRHVYPSCHQPQTRTQRDTCEQVTLSSLWPDSGRRYAD